MSDSDEHVAERREICRRFALAAAKIEELAANGEQLLMTKDEPDVLFLLFNLELYFSHGLVESFFFGSKSVWHVFATTLRGDSFRR